MKCLLSMALLGLVISSCATTNTKPAPTPEQMPLGREVCKSLCASVGRNYLEYRYNGDCVCK